MTQRESANSFASPEQKATGSDEEQRGRCRLGHSDRGQPCIYECAEIDLIAK
jgi:hypothetical protein